MAMLSCWAIGLRAAASSVASPGALDPSFGQMGEFAFQTNDACHPVCPEFIGSRARTLALAPDGKLLIAGENVDESSIAYEEGPRSTLVRLTDDGTLDGAFGSGGFAQPPPFGFDRLYVQADGGVVGAGVLEIGIAGGGGVERYTASGSATGEVLRLAMPVLPQGPPIGGGVPQIDSSGRFVVLGGTISPLVRQGNEPKLIRFLATGALDEGFGSGGIASLPPPIRKESHPFGSDTFALADDGSVFVTAGIYPENHTNEERQTHIVLYHFKPSGRLDSSFGRSGMVVLPSSGGYEDPALAVAPNGGVVPWGNMSRGSLSASDCWSCATRRPDGRMIHLAATA